jgi:hypothetical protein
MATTAKRSSKSKEPVLPENHTPSQAIAHAITTQYADLAPSVNRIMEAELREPGMLHAITLFRDSLGVLGDPNRNPAEAIERGKAIDAID